MRYVIPATLSGLTLTQKGLELYLKHFGQKTYLYNVDGIKLKNVPSTIVGVRVLTKDFGDSLKDIPFASILPYTLSLGEIYTNDPVLLHIIYIYGSTGIFKEDVQIVDI